MAVHGVLYSTAVCLVTLRRKLLFAVITLSATDLEGGDDSIPDFALANRRTDRFDDSTEFVAEDVTFLQVDDRAMEEMHVATTNRRARDFENNIGRVNDFRLVCVDYSNVVGTVPGQCLHLLSRWVRKLLIDAWIGVGIGSDWNRLLSGIRIAVFCDAKFSKLTMTFSAMFAAKLAAMLSD